MLSVAAEVLLTWTVVKLVPSDPAALMMSALDPATLVRSALILEEVQGVPSDVVVVLFIVPCYRLLLSGEKSAWGSGVSRRRVYGSYLAWALFLTIGFVGPSLALALAGDEAVRGFSSFIEVALFCVYAYVTTRLAFVSPMICLGHPWHLRRRWAETRGNVWRLIAVYLVVIVPLFVPMIGALTLWEGFVRSPTDDLMGIVPSEIVFTTVALSASALSVAATVAAQVTLTGADARGMPSGRQSPRRLVEVFD
ncbi:MAG: hypothetical protein HKM95_04070 [Inquilinus sp.]|nr:hypothetical protein [Inquilinus sp.]